VGDPANLFGTPGALAGGMNAIFFGLKRAFHSTLRVTRRMLTRLGLTAARFDMLHALPRERRYVGEGMRQSELRRQLGVSRPTVSRMLASLEELGLVLRKPDSKDRRQVFVALTEAEGAPSQCGTGLHRQRIHPARGRHRAGHRARRPRDLEPLVRRRSVPQRGGHARNHARKSALRVRRFRRAPLRLASRRLTTIGRDRRASDLQTSIRPSSVPRCSRAAGTWD
jgi:DNA-binding MarR family transcriptional regulator